MDMRKVSIQDLKAHLSALWFHEAGRIDRFVTMDTSQEHAARELGLQV